MENQCGVKYIFQLFESRTVLQPILAALWETEVSLSTAKGLSRKAKLHLLLHFFTRRNAPVGVK